MFFCDASSQAYGAVAYIVTDDNPNNPSFLLAKSHVAPRHAEVWSILRKELIAVPEGARAAILSWEALKGRIKNVTMWTDATTVLSWLTNDSIQPNRFIHRKLDKLNSLYHHFGQDSFRHVQTNMNPADVAS